MAPLPKTHGAAAPQRSEREVPMLGGMVRRGLMVVLALAAWAGYCRGALPRRHHQGGRDPDRHQPEFPAQQLLHDKNELEGFDIDVGNKIAEALKLKAEFVPTETPQRVPFLVADKIDISLGALTRSAERAKLITYTVPLHTEVMAVLTTDKADDHQLEAAQRRQVHARQHARQLVGRLAEGASCPTPRSSWSTPSPTRSAWSRRAAPTRSSRTSTSSCATPRTTRT